MVSLARRGPPTGILAFNSALDRAMEVLAATEAPKELAIVADAAEALRTFARRARLGLVAQNRAAELRLRSERRLGEILISSARQRQGRPKIVSAQNHFLPRLSDLGITKALSHRAQRLAAIDEHDFEDWLQEAWRRDREIVTRDLLAVAEQRQAAERNRRNVVGGQVDDLHALIRTGFRAGCILIDPPWDRPGSSVPYETIGFDELAALPIRDLADPHRAHLHVWSLGNECLFALKPIIEGWGFRLVSTFTWTKTGSLGRGNYWRMSHEILLSCVWGDRDDRFDDHHHRSWLESPRGAHSEKPEAVRQMLETASPGPRIELFGRKLVPNWLVWGHEVVEPLSTQIAE